MAENNEETPNIDRPDAGRPDQGTGPDAPPSNHNEEVEAAATDEAPAAEATPDASADDATETPAPAAKSSRGGPSRREKLEAKRAERRVAAGKRQPRTPEERDAERRERRVAVAKQRRASRQRLKTKRAAAGEAAPPREEQHAPEHGPGRPKVRQGIVVSEKGEKTITVRIDVVKRHKRYHKILRSTVKLHAHDERGDAHEGDTVRVVECRPMSRTKRWRLVEVLERAK